MEEPSSPPAVPIKQPAGTNLRAHEQTVGLDAGGMQEFSLSPHSLCVGLTRSQQSSFAIAESHFRIA